MDFFDEFGQMFSRFDENNLNYLMEFGLLIVSVVLTALLIGLIISIVLYVFRSAGCYHIAKRRGIHNPWLAWVPVAQLWILGCISDQYQYVVRGKIRNRRKILLGLSIASFILNLVTNRINSAALYDYRLSSGFSGVMLVRMGFTLAVLTVAVVLLVFRCIALYDLYSSCCPDNNVLFLVLGILFPFTTPFFIFCNRKKDLGMPPRVQQPVYQQPVYQQPQDPWNNP